MTQTKKKNKNTEYEHFTRKVFACLSEQKAVKTITLQHNMKLQGKSGARHQIDVYWEYEQDGRLHKVAIECKNYAKKLSIGKVRDFYGVLVDIDGLRDIMVTKVGYQSGAMKYASSVGVHLKELRSPTKPECIAGQIITDFHISMRRCLYLIDKEWTSSHNIDINHYLRWMDAMSIKNEQQWVNASHVPLERKS